MNQRFPENKDLTLFNCDIELNLRSTVNYRAKVYVFEGFRV